MRTYQHTSFAALSGHNIFSGGHKSDAGVGSAFGVNFEIDMDFAFPQRCETCS
jgi:hypothetical protein